MRIVKRLIAASEDRITWFFSRKNLCLMLVILIACMYLGILDLQTHGDYEFAFGYVIILPTIVLALLMTPPQRRESSDANFFVVERRLSFESADHRVLTRPPIR